MERHIDFGTRRISYSLSFKNRKSLGVKVYPDTTVKISAPTSSDEIEVTKKIREKAPWIIKQQDFFNSFKPSTPQRKFVNGETHLYLGRQYKLKVIPAEADTIKAYRGHLFIYTTKQSKAEVAEQLQKWYKQKADVIFHDLLQELLPLFKRYKIAEPMLYIRKMTKRWGSCTPTSKIILNVELIKAPKGSIEYVLIHELCHLVQYNHTKAFYNLQDKIMPDWKKWKERLEYCLA